MGKIYTALGLMSGTSMDGVDASVIQSDGNREYSIKLEKYFKYEDDIRKELVNLRDKVVIAKDLTNHSKIIKSVEREITLFHANIVNKIISSLDLEIDFVGFHGQTIYHDPKIKISKQIGDGKLLSQLTKKLVIYDFRKNDIMNGGQGAPLTPIYHKLLAKIFKEERKINLPITFFNIGGIANITVIKENYEMTSMDIGPGNCLIDRWIRVNTGKNFDKDGAIAKSGNIDKFILEQTIDNFYYNISNKKKSLDINDFDISFVKGLSLEDGAATITELTAEVLSKNLTNKKIFVCGGGRKNQFLIETIEKKINNKLINIDDFNINGNFVESQAFGYLAVRSYLKLPISFPETTGCSKPCVGGTVIKNF